MYYNEWDPFAAEWIRQLIKAEQIPLGVVDERDIRDVSADDVRGYPVQHYFAGIGGWPYALKLAGWGDRPVWTVSCPCQPFSQAGQRKGTADERHLWPVVCDLVAECRPPVIFGEQVASPLGREWFAGVRLDLENLGYAVGCADLCAASIGAPHIRQRLWWVAYSQGERFDGQQDTSQSTRGISTQDSGNTCRVGDSCRTGLERWESQSGDDGQEQQATERTGCDVILCRDGKARRTQSGVRPLAHGVSNRVGRLRGLGNAIVPQVAATFIQAFMMSQGEPPAEEPSTAP